MPSFLRSTLAGSCLLAASFSALSAQTPSSGVEPRITQGSIHQPYAKPEWATSAADQGGVADDTPIHLTFVLARTPQQQAAFVQFLESQQDPSSPQYHQWLTPAQVGDQFGPSLQDISALTGWLAARGLPNAQVSPSRVFVNVTATAATVSGALATSIHLYGIAGASRFAATTSPAIPDNFAPFIRSVEGLADPAFITNVHILPDNGSAVPQPRTVRPNYNVGGAHYIVPDDFATLFDLKTSFTAGFTGTGQRVAVIARSRVDSNDIQAFESIIQRGTNLPYVVLPNPIYDPGLTNNGDQAEATLDVERVIATAPLAQVDLVAVSSAGNGVTAATQYAVNTLNDPVLNLSYGSCETNFGQAGVAFWDTLFSQAAAQGISTTVSSGDSGVAGCDQAAVAAPATQTASINALCASSYVTCVGGTQLNDAAGGSNYWNSFNNSLDGSAVGYLPEGAWNQPNGADIGLSGYIVFAGGGGASAYIPKPAWQTGVGVPSDGARDIPDVSFPSSGYDGYYGCYANSCSGGRFTIFFGTSVAAPSMAGIAALINQRTGQRQGNLNPALYRLAATPSNNVFHDATPASSGVAGCSVLTPSICNNSTPSTSALTGGLAGFVLTPGYDLATGWGSMDVGNLLGALGATQAPTTATTTFSAPIVYVGDSITFTTTITSTTAGHPGGYVQFYLNGNPFGAAVPVTAAGIATTPPLAFPVIAGISFDTVNAYYSGDAAFAPSTANSQQFELNKYQPTMVLTPTSATIPVTTPQGFTVSLTGTKGTPTGTVQFRWPFGATFVSSTVNVSNGTATLPPTTFYPGNPQLQASYSGDSIYNPVSANANLQVIGLTPTVTLTSNTTSISPPQAVTFTANVSGAGAAPTGTVSLVVDNSPFNSPTTISGAATVLPPVSLPFGTHNVWVTYVGDSLYGTGKSNTIVVTESGFTLSSSGYGLQVVANPAGTTAATLTYQSGGGFTGPITQTCAITANNTNQLNFAPQCSFSPATVTLAANGSATSVLSISSTLLADNSSMPALPGRDRKPATAAFACLLAIACVRKRRRLSTLLALTVATLMLSSLTACGGSSSTSGSGSGSTTLPSTSAYTMVITGTSGSVVVSSGNISLQMTH
jgi:pseudomonalisin